LHKYKAYAVGPSNEINVKESRGFRLDIIKGVRVNRPVTKHLSTQGRLDPRGGLHCFCCPNKT